MVDKEIVEAAQKWLELLRQQAKVSHTVELASSSVNDLALALENLLKSHGVLSEASKDLVVVKERLDRLEKAGKARQELSKAKPQPHLVKESDDAVA